MRDMPLILYVPWGKNRGDLSSFEGAKREKPRPDPKGLKDQAAAFTRPLVKRWVERTWKKEKPRGNGAQVGEKQ